MTSATRELPLDRLWSHLRCPVCHAGIEFKKGMREIRCAACSEAYPVLPGGIPVMLIPAQRSRVQRILAENTGGRKMVEGYRRHGTWRAKVRAIFRPPAIVYDEDVARKHSWIYNTRGPDTIVLSIGGGPGRENPRVINLNLDAFDSVDLVGDGTNLPLADSCVDTVTCNAVIEHVPNPTDLVLEMYRILKPGGHAQFMIPFVFPFHEFPGDYQRYTASGILELTRAFEKVELCILTGPTSTMLVLFREYFRLLIPGGDSGFMRLALNGVSGWLTFWMKYLDRWLNRKARASDLAAAFYYLGRKPADQA
jgi:SAM-dependent methyltransferase/uncharacterized protein YbaR (Trm112 family)